MSDLMPRRSLVCLEIGEARRLAAKAIEQSCAECRPALKLLKGKIDSAYVMAEGYDLTKSKHEFEEKHAPGTPFNQPIRQKEQAYLRLVRECSAGSGNGDGSDGTGNKNKGHMILHYHAAHHPQAG